MPYQKYDVGFLIYTVHGKGLAERTFQPIMRVMSQPFRKMAFGVSVKRFAVWHCFGGGR